MDVKNKLSCVFSCPWNVYYFQLNLTLTWIYENIRKNKNNWLSLVGKYVIVKYPTNESHLWHNVKDVQNYNEHPLRGFNICAFKGSIHVAFLWSILKFITNLKMFGEGLRNKKYIQISKPWKKPI
jgi:hypothetical protein